MPTTPTKSPLKTVCCVIPMATGPTSPQSVSATAATAKPPETEDRFVKVNHVWCVCVCVSVCVCVCVYEMCVGCCLQLFQVVLLRVRV